jgi:tetratricopeptide (TPR) repeat protein
MKYKLLLFLFCLALTNSYSQTKAEAIKQGDDFLTAANYVEAIKAYTTAISLDTTSSESYFKRGQAYFFAADDAQAVVDYNKALALNPKNPQIYFMRGQSREYLKDLAGAQADYGMAIMLDSNYVIAYVKRAYIFLGMGQIMPAFVCFSKAITKDPNQPADVYFARGYCLQETKAYQQALDDYAKAIELKPSYPEAFLNSGNSARMLKKYDEALVFYEKALKINPTYATVYYARGFLYLDKGDLVNACNDWTKAVELGDHNVQPYIDQHCNKK